jgi:hypothetical protein
MIIKDYLKQGRISALIRQHYAWVDSRIVSAKQPGHICYPILCPRDDCEIILPCGEYETGIQGEGCVLAVNAYETVKFP